MKVKVTGVVQPIGLIASGFSPSLIVVPTLGHDVKPDGYAQVPPCIHQHLGASPLVEVCPGHET